MSAPPRRIVTGHDASGRSVVLSDGPVPKSLELGPTWFHAAWVTEGMPVPIPAEEPEPTDRPLRVPPPPDGVVVWLTDMPPGAEAPIHRTETVDVGVVLEGETWLLLDDGSETLVRTGDIVLQRGTMHGWVNRSDHPVRMLFVIIDGSITAEVRAKTGPLEFFDDVIG
jgi:quercetin dioxygenase-like cupin family protein